MLYGGKMKKNNSTKNVVASTAAIFHFALIRVLRDCTRYIFSTNEEIDVELISDRC